METSQHGKESTSVMDLGGLLDAGDGAVVTLEAGETRLAAHRAVLSARSPVFAAMFAHDTQEARTGRVAVPDVEGRVLRLLLAFLYTLQAPQLPDVAPQLLAAADKYAVAALKDACEQQVAAQLSVETAAAAAVLAIRHSCSSLRQAAVAFIKSHSWEVMTTQGWFDAVRMHHEEMDELRRLLSETSTPPSVASGTRPPPTAQPPSGRSQNPAPATSYRTPPPDDAAISRLWSLSAEEKNRRLIEAAEQGAVGQLEALLAAGADAGAMSPDRRTALHWAAIHGHEEVARRLLAAGAAVDHRDSWGQRTPLHWAAGRGHAAVVRLLLDYGADHSPRAGGEGWTALHWAVASGHTEAAAALLQGGADRGARDRGGNTPLDTARQRRHQQMVDLLQGRRPPHSH